MKVFLGIIELMVVLSVWEAGAVRGRSWGELTEVRVQWGRATLTQTDGTWPHGVASLSGSALSPACVLWWNSRSRLYFRHMLSHISHLVTETIISIRLSCCKLSDPCNVPWEQYYYSDSKQDRLERMFPKTFHAVTLWQRPACYRMWKQTILC